MLFILNHPVAAVKRKFAQNTDEIAIRERFTLLTLLEHPGMDLLGQRSVVAHA
jgi:hypothetical protein